MPFTGDSFSHLFDWEKDPQRQEKIVNSRLESEFDGVDTGLSAVAARVTVLEGSSGIVAGHIYGLTLANNAGDATNDIDIATGYATDSTFAASMNLASALTKRLDASWTVGTNQGGLDTGSIADTTYHVHLIQRSDTGVVDVLFSASPTAPTMPTNYDRKRRIGSFVRLSGVIKPFIQDGDLFMWSDGPVLDVNVTDVGASAITRTLTVPTGIRVLIFGTVRIASTTNAEAIYLSDLSMPDIAPTLTGIFTFQQAAGGTAGAGQFHCMSNTAAQVRSREVSGAGGSSLRISAAGWYDSRGR